MVHGSRYGGRYDPKTTMFAVDIASTRMKSLHRTAAPYARFPFGEFKWVEVPLAVPQKAPSKFRVIVDFDPAATRGVYVAWSGASSKASFTGRAGGSERSWDKGAWMIRVRLVSEKPEPPAEATPEGRDPKVYVKDFEYIQRTVRDSYPALKKKGVDWKAVCKEWKERFAACRDDETHVLNARRLLAVLSDSHTGITKSQVEAHAPHWDGLYGAGMWIATEGGHHILHSLMPGHALEEKLRPGALLVSIDGRPAPTVHEEVRAKMREWSGWSSTHFLDARLSFQFFPFGAKQTMPARFVNPDGEVVDVELSRWGPQGRGLRRAAVTMPEGIEATGLAVSGRLSAEIGYVRILGGMNEETRKAFFAAVDELQGVQGILLDCRGMGGGGDAPAWAMAGRFFAERARLKHDPALKPTGDWQFTGPVVMLQDERMMSSAETFTWSMAETGRVVTVGRPTGGATIIPRSFEAPSRMFSFRMGCRDRETSVDGVQPEGKGSPPHVFVPYDPALFARSPDPVRAVGLDVLRHLLAGADRDVVVGVYDGVLSADADRLASVLDAWRSVEAFGDLVVPDLTTKLVGAMATCQKRYLEAEANEAPDEAGVRRRLKGLAAVAKVLGVAESD
jgi:C-terminal processing protease CtpA/Prc